MCSLARTVLADEVSGPTGMYFLTVLEAVSPRSRVGSFDSFLVGFRRATLPLWTLHWACTAVASDFPSHGDDGHIKSGPSLRPCFSLTLFVTSIFKVSNCQRQWGGDFSL